MRFAALEPLRTSCGSSRFDEVGCARTDSNHNSTEIARCVEVCLMSSGWFDCTELSLSTVLQGVVNSLLQFL